MDTNNLSPEKKDDEASVNSVDVITESPAKEVDVIPLKKSPSAKGRSPSAKGRSSKVGFAEKVDPRESLGFRNWDDQQKAVDEFHQKEADKKAMEEQKKAQELAAKEAEIYKRTQTGFDQMKKIQAEKERQERLRREEEAKRKEEEAHAKHHKLRQDLAASEKAKLEAEMKEKEKFEAKRKRKLDEQAAKMKKFEENQRWKKLPNYKKEKEKELLKKLKQLKSYDPKKSKYDFFDVHRLPDAWDEELLDAELKKAKHAKGEELLNQLKGLLPDVEKVNFFKEDSEDQWDFPSLEKNIAIQTEEVKAEEVSGSLAFERLILVNPGATKDRYWNAFRRPRWLVAEMDTEFIEKVKVIFSIVKQYKPDITEDAYCKDGEWQVTSMQKDIADCKFQLGDKKYNFMEEVMKVASEPVDKTKYFNENDINTPWNLELMDKDLNDRFVTVIKITKEEDSTIVNKKLVVGKGWSYDKLWNELTTIVNLPEDQNERLTIIEIDGQADPNVNAKLGDLMKHQSVVTATLAAPVNDGCCTVL